MNRTKMVKEVVEFLAFLIFDPRHDGAIRAIIQIGEAGSISDTIDVSTVSSASRERERFELLRYPAGFA